MSRKKRIFQDKNALIESMAQKIVQKIQKRTESERSFSLVLTGGNTPRPLYRLLASDFTDQIPWEKMQIFWGDERYVPHTHEESNYRMARKTLLDAVPVPEDNVYPMPTHLTNTEECAKAYDTKLKKIFRTDYPQFDLILLGMGGDGHIASLFPGTPALDESEKWVTNSEAPAKPKHRITLTYPVLNNATDIFFLVSGEKKAEAVKKAFSSNIDKNDCPAAYIKPEIGQVTWWLDEAATVKL